MAWWAVFMVAAFLSGSIPFALLIGRRHGIDIRKHGSGNLGATNVGRVLGRPAGYLCFALDALKGLAPTLGAGVVMGLAPASAFNAPIAVRDAWLWAGVMALAVLGHVFSPWVGFRGGKGVAAGLGATLGVFPYLTIPGLGALVLWIAVVRATRYVSLASIVAAAVLPVIVFGWALVSAARRGVGVAEVGPWPLYVVSSLVALLVVWRHRGNIQRLRAGTENRIGGGRARG